MSLEHISFLHSACDPLTCTVHLHATTPSAATTNTLILGAGTFGLSTALHLLRRGHRNVTVIDPYLPPSPISAGNDSNKILIVANHDRFLTQLSLEALSAWRTDPIFYPYLHENGIVIAGCSKKVIRDLDLRASDWAKRHGRNPRPLTTPHDFADVIPSLTGRLPGWSGYHLAGEGGWVEARNALISVANECRRLGANFEVGEATTLVFGDSGQVLGARTSDGREYLATTTVIAMGANSVRMLNFEGQLLAKCWTLAHIPVSPNEPIGAAMKDSPLLLSFDKGFFFEPDENGEVKVCNEFPGYTNHRPEDGLSVPMRYEQIPLEAEHAIRELLAETIPDLMDRPLHFARICWCADTPDRRFLITEHPAHDGLVIATGGSGLAFKFLPTIGRYIADVVDGGPSALSPANQEAWRWRPETVVERTDSQGRYGGEGRVKDLAEVRGWTQIQSRSWAI